MDPELYRAAMEGNPNFLGENGDQFETLFQVTPNKNTALHVAAQFHDKPEFAEKILTMQSSLLTLVNSKGETALLIAARHGRSETVKSLIAFSKTLEEEDPEGQRRITKEMMRMANEEKDTALFEAVRYNHMDVLKLLLKEEPELANVVNESMETPLYLAVEKGYHGLALEILRTCVCPAYAGPDGKTALHAAAIRNCEKCTQSLMPYAGKALLLKKTDKYGWTPLHYAAYLNHTKVIRKLLEEDSSTAYIFATEDENQTAFHLAARNGSTEVMEIILWHRPDCWDVVNSRSQNVLHIAVESRKKEVIRYILQQPWFSILINQKDIDGNTPLHLLSAFDMEVPQLINDNRTDKVVFNKLNLAPLDIVPRMIPEFDDQTSQGSIKKQLEKAGAEEGWRNIVRNDRKYRTRWNKDHVEQVLKQTRRDVKKKDSEWNEKFVSYYGTHVIVASLIATVTFAAGFTVPGGYNENEGPERGKAILERKATFKAFLITDTVALMSSSSALILYFMSSVAAGTRQWSIVTNCYQYASWLNLIALATMVLAFVTGVVAGLQNSHAIFVNFCALVFSFLLLIVFSKLYNSAAEAGSN